MSLIDDVIKYYAERAPHYDETAGYTDPEAEELRIPIKDRYREMFTGRHVLEIACGTGYWTEVVAEAAASVLALDVNAQLISRAEDRCRHLSNVAFHVCDAFSLEGIPKHFTGAFGIWWWSHVPKKRIEAFLRTLHSRLIPGALVLFADQLPYEGHARRLHPDGDTLEVRSLPDGRTFEIIKNFPTEDEVTNVVRKVADNIEYVVRPDEKSWSVVYNRR